MSRELDTWIPAVPAKIEATSVKRRAELSVRVRVFLPTRGRAAKAFREFAVSFDTSRAHARARLNY